MPNIIYLPYIETLRRRIDADSPLIQVVLGPRQVGKTTTILKLIDDYYSRSAHYVSTDGIFNASPAWLREQWLQAASERKILFIDEIQKSENWAETIKSLHDDSKRAKKRVPCVLLGSSSLQIQKGLSESLTGRFQLLRAHHWNFSESKQGYNLSFAQYIKFGGYPGSYPMVNTDEWADFVKNSIVATVIDKDILLYQTVKSPALFKQAFEILVNYPAQEVSYTKLLGQLQDKGNVDLIKYYLSLYEGAYLIRALEKFSKTSHLKKGSSPNILPLAPCLPYLQHRQEYTTDEEGRILELLVGAQLSRTDQELYYWREGSYEVDYVLTSGKNVWAIEVKSGRKRSLQGLDRFKSKVPSCKQVLITKENYFDFERDPLNFLEKMSL
ncbi:MAG: AAA family ATPase [Proteobacteria bacterium]|nr:MAG: AAA family ATPase [Pseudomonadota bacterium]